MPHATRQTPAWKHRAWAAATALACLALLITGATLNPSPEGHGTHTQTGLPPCLWAQTFDTPCLTCGMTTAVTHAARASLWQSFTTQPLGFAIALGAATTFWLALYTAATGARLDRLAASLFTAKALWLLAAAALAAWIFKVITW